MTQVLTPPQPQKSDGHYGSITGFSSPDEPGLCVPVPARRPLSLAWVSDELIAETRRLWSIRYEREVSVDEAIEMLQNVKRFAEMLLERSEK
jgi:hypothetical protein